MKGITSPEGIIMLIVAAILDLIGFIIFALGTWFGVDDYGILEIIGIVIFGSWMFVRYSALGSEGGMRPAQQQLDNEELDDEGGQEKEQGEQQALPERDKPEKKQEANAEPEAPKKDGEKPGKGSAPEKQGVPAKATTSTPQVSGKSGSTTIKGPKEVIKDQAKELAKKALKRFCLTFLIELIPFLGGFYPGWTIFVWKEMKDEPVTMPKRDQKTSKAAQAQEREPQYSSKA